MKYKRKGLDFCAVPGCLNMTVFEWRELTFCAEHDPDELPNDYQWYMEYCQRVAEGQQVEFGKYADGN